MRTAGDERPLTRRDILRGAAGIAGGASPPSSGAADRHPNVILLNTDDQRFDTIHALGNREILTPNLDTLVRRGMSFRNFYSQGGMISAMCVPSRTMLMTARSLFRIPGPKDLPPGMPLLPKAFERAGYATFHHGKKSTTYVPASEAFQKIAYSGMEPEVRAQQSEIVADAVIDYIRTRDPARPFFAYLAPPVPHDPRLAPKKFMDMYDPAKIRLPKNFMPRHPFDYGDPGTGRDENLAPIPRTPDVMRRHIADYYASITCLDYHVGRILAELEKSGLTANTIFVFTSDQGLSVGGRHGLMGKQNLYEDFKGPLVFAGPGIRRGQSDAMAYMHDLFPTLCELAGIATPQGIEGVSFAPAVRGSRWAGHEYIFGAYMDCQRMIRDRRYKLIWYPKAKRYQLFDLARDAWEIHNLADQPGQSARLEHLRRKLTEHQDRYGDPLARPPAPSPRKG
jgi:arylsulfatase A-like enzyme